MHPNHARPVNEDLDIYRKIFHKFVVKDENSEDGFRISTKAFQNTTGTLEMSCQASDTLADCENPPETLLEEGKWTKVAAFPAGVATALDQRVERTPIDKTDPCDAHMSVIGDKTPEIQHGFVDAIRIVAG